MTDVVDGDFQTAPFRTIGIVGLGLIGGSLALALRDRFPDVTIVGADRADVLAAARARGIVDATAPDVSALVASEAGRPDLIVLAAPVLQNLTCLQQLATGASLIAEVGARADAAGSSADDGAAARRDARLLVTDVGSTKRVILEAARAGSGSAQGSGPRTAASSSTGASSGSSGAFRFVGGHPMAGAAQGGLEFARADLFDGRPWLLTPGVDASTADVDRLIALVRGLGAMPRVMDAAEHDKLMAYISHLPQMVSSALMRTVGERVGEDGLSLSGPGLADTTRLASSPAGVWTDICETNADLIDAALDAIQTEIRAVRQHLRKPEDLAAWLVEGGRWRARMPPRAG